MNHTSKDIIKDYRVFKAEAPLSKPIADATHKLTTISFIVLRIELESGIVGESYLLAFQYSPNAIMGAIHDVGALVKGEPVNETGKVFEKLNAANEYFGVEGVNRWAQSLFNIAMWDAWCRVLDQPIWKVLGTYNHAIPVYGSGGWLSYAEDELIDEIRGYRSRGFRAIKVKVGKPDIKEDIERLKIAREAAGKDMQIMMDANQGMTVSQAVELARAAAGLNIHWFEEPVDHTDFKGYQFLRNQAGVSIAMGEREYSSLPLRELINLNAIDLWQPDILRIGGVEAWKSSADLAASNNIGVHPHFYKDYDVPLLCTIPSPGGAESFDWIDNLIDEPLQIDNGLAYPRQGPGWGFRFLDKHLQEIS